MWTMQNNIAFDNIFIGDDIEEAKKFASDFYFAKHEKEIELEKEKVIDYYLFYFRLLLIAQKPMRKLKMPPSIMFGPLLRLVISATLLKK